MIMMNHKKCEAHMRDNDHIRVFVLNHDKTPLMPTTPRRARLLLKKGRAAVFRRFPFTIILKEQNANAVTQPMTLGIDSGAKYTGLSLILHGDKGQYAVFGAEIEHRTDISESLKKRSAIRRSRRSRKLRYRAPRFLNRKNRVGKLPPSLESKVNNVMTWTKRFSKLCPLANIRLETTKFDTQLLQAEENQQTIEGKQYQQGPLYGYQNRRQYLLQRDNGCCQYCGSTGSKENPLEVEHVLPRSKGGTDRIGNLVIACHKCNQAKSNMLLEEFVTDPKRLKQIKAKLSSALTFTGQVNSLRLFLMKSLENTGLNLTVGYGYETAANRKHLKLPKHHWIDATVCTKDGVLVKVNPNMKPLLIKAMGRGNRQMCRNDKYGFPCSAPRLRQKYHFGFATGDIVKVTIPDGFKTPKGTYIGRVTVQKAGQFKFTTKRSQTKMPTPHRFCQVLQRNDGYDYGHTSRA